MAFSGKNHCKRITSYLYFYQAIGISKKIEFKQLN